MNKKLIYILIALVLVAGLLYIVLNKEAPDTADIPKEPDDSEEVVEKPEEFQPGADDPQIEDGGDIPLDTEEYPTGDLPEIEVGKKLPDFTLKNLAGKDVSLRELEGKIVLINFWATWCPWCDKEMADLQRLDSENEDLMVLGVNVDETKAQAEKYLQEGGYKFEVVLDEGGKVSSQYLVTGLPASYFVNKDGIFVGNIPSFMTYEQMNEALQIVREYKE